MSETYPNKGTRETLFAGHIPSSVGIDCKITTFFSFLQILNTKTTKLTCKKFFIRMAGCG